MPTFRPPRPPDPPIGGNPSGSQTHRTDTPLEQAMVDCGVYVDGQRLPGKQSPRSAMEKVQELGSGFVWIGLHEPDEHQMQTVADVFGLHPLAVEDAVHAHQRPKLERYDDTLFLVLKTVNYVPHESISLTREIVETGEIMVFIGPEFVVTVRHGNFGGLVGLRKEMEAKPGHLGLGPYAVMHAVAQHVVDSYRDITTLMEADIDTVQEETFAAGRKTDIEQIYLLKRETVELRRAIRPLSAALERITTEHQDLVPAELMGYMRDVVDHQHDAADRIINYDDVLSSLVQAAVGRVGVQQNTDMRKIAAWVSIAAVVTMVAGIYGMNFEHMPELRWVWAYPAVLAVMASICVFLYRTLRRNHWL